MFGHQVAVKRLTAAIVLGLFGVSVAPAHAAAELKTIRIESGQQNFACTLNGFTVSAAGEVNVKVAGCNPALGTGGGGDTGGGDTGGGDTGGGNTGGGNTGGGNTGGGSVGGADPGVGTWSPALDSDPRVVIVDQSGAAGTTKTVVPGCVNGGDADWGAWCSTQSQYQTSINGQAVNVRLTKGQILGVRYPLSGTSRTGSTGVLRLTNPVGGALGVDTKISLSSVPGDMSGDGQARCVNQATTTPSVTTGTTAFACRIDRSKSVYYLNIQVQNDCSGSNCIFHISEESAEFK